MMNKTRFLSITIALLALLNVVLLAALWKRPTPPPHEGPRKIIIERLQLDEAQVAAYDLLVAKHRADIQQKDTEMAAARQALYHQLQSNDFSKNDSLLAGIGRLQMKVEQIHLAHFQDIKNLCRGAQIPEFERLSSELERLFAKPKRVGKK
jgi:periplasmic protein CpxP/Spy